MLRVQVLLTGEEREAFRRMARREGLSLSAWLRRAAKERLAAEEERRRFTDGEELRRFFEACDRRERGRGPEPGWEEHEEVIRRSRASGGSET